MLILLSNASLKEPLISLGIINNLGWIETAAIDNFDVMITNTKKLKWSMTKTSWYRVTEFTEVHFLHYYKLSLLK